MTDPRVEAAARALCEIYGHDPDADEAMVQSGMGANWCAYEDEARAALAAADAAAWRALADQMPPEPVLIMSQHGAAVAQWDAGIGAWRNEDMMYSPQYFTHWQPLPAPPTGE